MNKQDEAIMKEISQLIRTPNSRDALENLSDAEKLKLILRLTDSKNTVYLLEFIDQAIEDADWCSLYR